MIFKGTIPPELLESVRHGKCILFVGSGLSAKIKRRNEKQLPLWGDFLKELLEWAKSKNAMFWNGSDEVKKIIESGNYLIAAQELQECITLGEFSEFLNSIFRDPNVKPTELHKNIFKIPFRAILTTNYDNLLEGAFALTHNGQVPVKFVQEDLRTISSPLRTEDFFIFKIHGDIDRPNTIILGSRSYNQLLFRTPEYLHFLETLFTTHTVLFVGFGGNDTDFDFIINRLSTIYSRTLNKHYILLPKEKYNLTEKRRLLLDKRLEVIDYESDESHSHVDKFFDALKHAFDSSKKTIEKKKVEDEVIEKIPVAKFAILSSDTFEKKYRDLITSLMKELSKSSAWHWFYGLDSMNEQDYLYELLKNSTYVIIFFDSEVKKISEIESLLDILTLREVDQKIKIIPIIIDSVDVPVVLRRRTIHINEPLEKDLIKMIILDEMYR